MAGYRREVLRLGAHDLRADRSQGDEGEVVAELSERSGQPEEGGEGQDDVQGADPTRFLREPTVKTYVTRILAKLQLRDRVQAVVPAYESGLVQPGPR